MNCAYLTCKPGPWERHISTNTDIRIYRRTRLTTILSYLIPSFTLRYLRYVSPEYHRFGHARRVRYLSEFSFRRALRVFNTLKLVDLKLKFLLCDQVGVSDQDRREQCPAALVLTEVIYEPQQSHLNEHLLTLL
jgi:hypothetical protein